MIYQLEEKYVKMCPEFILALIYLIIILLINILLLNILKSYQKNIIGLLKLKNIFSSFDKKEIELISVLYQNSKKEMKEDNFFNSLQNFSKMKDILIIGNIYRAILNSENLKENSSIFYFRLLQEQYLSTLNSLKY